MEQLNVLELYSGIGGMHAALDRSGISFTVAAAVDINEKANEVYRHNYPSTNLIQRNIESLTVSELAAMNVNAILMSPPCQPFTRQGCEKDTADPRCKSLLALLDVLPNWPMPPKYILLENVVGFESSSARSKLIHCLKDCKYVYKEFLLSPVQFGIPNSRLRYYLIAKHQNCELKLPTPISHCYTCSIMLQYSVFNSTKTECSTKHFNSAHDNLVVDMETECTEVNSHELPFAKLESESAKSGHSEQPRSSYVMFCEFLVNNKTLCNCITKDMLELSHYLEVDPPTEEFLVPKQTLQRFLKVMDVIHPQSTRSCCFTKAYGRYAEGTGSVLLTNGVQANKITELKSNKCADVVDASLRYFTPKEIANIMYFPSSFNFPTQMSSRDCYKLLGNSLNVHVVSVLIRLLVAG